MKKIGSKNIIVCCRVETTCTGSQIWSLITLIFVFNARVYVTGCLCTSLCVCPWPCVCLCLCSFAHSIHLYVKSTLCFLFLSVVSIYFVSFLIFFFCSLFLYFCSLLFLLLVVWMFFISDSTHFERFYTIASKWNKKRKK